MSAASSSLTRLRVALLHALGVTVAAACTRPPLDDAGTATSSGPGTTSTSTAPGGTTLAPDPTTGAGTTTTTTTATTGPLTTATTAVDTGVVTTTGTVEPGTTTSTASTTSDSSTTTGQACIHIMDLGVELMPTDLLEIPGCEDYEASNCHDYLRACAPLPDGLQSCDECAPDCLGPIPELCPDFSFTLACGPFSPAVTVRRTGSPTRRRSKARSATLLRWK